MNKKILVITEMSFQGSGYYYVMQPLLQRLGSEYDIKVVGLGYNGEEYDFDFSIVACPTVQDSVVISSNIIKLWKPDLLMCALDIPLQMSIHESLKSAGIPYIAITPLENPPLTQTWAAHLMQMSHVFFISELGKNAAVYAGLRNASHLEVGIDTESIYNPTDEEKKQLRADLGYSPDEFILLTVADNQERKNLWAGLSIVSKLKEAGKKVRYILVTREHSPVGHRLRDLATTLNISKEVSILERGLPKEDLLKLYYASDLYLATSKAEGLCLPVMDAMASGLPVVATNTGALKELLSEGRGYLIDGEYEFIDVWGNSLRTMINIRTAFQKILNILEVSRVDAANRARMAMAYIKTRTYDKPVNQLKEKIEEVTNGKN